MKKFTKVILASTADAAIEALIAASGLASVAGTYQPKEPKELKKVVESRKEKK